MGRSDISSERAGGTDCDGGGRGGVGGGVITTNYPPVASLNHGGEEGDGGEREGSDAEEFGKVYGSVSRYTINNNINPNTF